MPIYQASVVSGQDFNGSGVGTLAFSDTSRLDATRRALIRSSSITNNGVNANTITLGTVYAAATLADAVGGRGLTLLFGTTFTSITTWPLAPVAIPAGWVLFCVTGGAGAFVKNWLVDYDVVTVGGVM